MSKRDDHGPAKGSKTWGPQSSGSDYKPKKIKKTASWGPEVDDDRKPRKQAREGDTEYYYGGRDSAHKGLSKAELRELRLAREAAAREERYEKNAGYGVGRPDEYDSYNREAYMLPSIPKADRKKHRRDRRRMM